MATITKYKTKPVDKNKTKAPTGLAISRNGQNYACSWKIADKNYDDLNMIVGAWKIGGNWLTNDYILNKSAAAKTITQPRAFSALYPYTSSKMTHVGFYASGKRADYTSRNESKKKKGSDTIVTIATRLHTYAQSDYTQRIVELGVPAPPSLSAALTTSQSTTFTWAAESKEDGWRPFARVQWQSMLVYNCEQTDGSKLTWSSGATGWQTGTGGASGSSAIAETSASIVNKSATRWFRVRSQGCAGDSGWVYAKHVYATPFTAFNLSGQAFVSPSANTTTIHASWSRKSTNANPVDSTVAQYLIAVPLTGVRPPDSNPTDLISLNVNNARVVQTISAVPAQDNCVWLRVRTRHDSNDAYTGYVRIYTGELQAPDTPTIVPDLTEHTVEVTAANRSSVPDSQLAVYFQGYNKSGKTVVAKTHIGTIAHGQDSGTFNMPTWPSGLTKYNISVIAFVGSVSQMTMRSTERFASADAPIKPANVTATQDANRKDEVIVSWSWTWDEANRAEISWSENPNAWESTDEPSTHIVTTKTQTRVRVSNLDMGVTWYFRVRLLKEDDGTAYGPYSDQKLVHLAQAPSIPTLEISPSPAVVTRNQNATLRWAYVTNDTTPQAMAEVCEATITSSGITYGPVIARVTSAQTITLPGSRWQTGTTHYLCVRVSSLSGMTSDGWSVPVPVTIAEELNCAITQTSLETITLTDDDGEERTVTALTEMPFTVTATGAGTGGTTTFTIIREEAFFTTRPDETEFTGFEGETITVISQTGEGQRTINVDDLLGSLDDGGTYRLIATVRDGLGQVAEDSVVFEVHWSHQAIAPTGDVWIDEDNDIAVLTAILPEGAVETDRCDIYRLSADRPVLVQRDAEWGTEYVDPYPTIGDDFGGYRFVLVTANGDYITDDDLYAWTDYEIGLEEESALINFGTGRVSLNYNIDVSNAWNKEFTETKYLGGSVQGDWNPAVSRTASVNAVSIPLLDLSTVEQMRRLATYPGLCHVRTPEGSSYSADVQVSESYNHSTDNMVATFSLSITRVDEQEPDGMTYEEWRRAHPEEGT